jgi:hypothetical protein
MPSFTVEYTQGTSGPGEITFSVGAFSSTKTASGRLDAVGSRVVSPTFKPAELGNAVLDTVVECVRTSSDAMRVVVVFVAGAYIGSGTERVIENVPLSFP